MNNIESFSFSQLPQTLAELQALPEASLDSPFKTAALTLLALARWETNKEECYNMFNFLRGPEPITERDKQFFRDRLMGKPYKVLSYFDGATVSNNYTPSMPYTLTIRTNPSSFIEENRCRLFIASAGADSPRPFSFRKKTSTGQWFLIDMNSLFLDIRIPASADPWA